MLNPFLIVGVGGSGGKTLRSLRHMLSLRLQQEGWSGGWPNAWQLLHIDSPTVQDGGEFPAPFLPTENYKGLVTVNTSYRQAHDAVLNGVSNDHVVDVNKSLPSEKDVAVNVGIGAGKFRAIGRTLVLAKMSEVQQEVKKAIDRVTSDGAIGELEALGKLLGAKPGQSDKSPIAIVISSIAGGSGAGQFIEVTEAIKTSAPSAQWIHEIFSLLYAPDVFQSVGSMDLIAPNALAAMTESMSGMWAQDLDQSTIALYESKTIKLPGLDKKDAKFHIGPKFNYVIGRQNSTITFKDQPNVYKAVAASLGTWMTDDKVQQKLTAYNRANFISDTGAMNLPDNAKLDDSRTAPPFASMGFGRVGLGKDIFLQYASERLARSAIDRMLYSHLRNYKAEEGNAEEVVQTTANQLLPYFLKDLGISTDDQGNDQLMTAIRPYEEREVLMTQFMSEISEEASQGVSPKTNGMSATKWVEDIQGSYVQRIQESSQFNLREKNNRDAKVRDWIQLQKQRTLQVVSRSVSQSGIKVGIELLRLLEIELQSRAAQLKSMSNSCSAEAQRTEGNISAAVQSAQGSAPIRRENAMIENALLAARNGFWYTAEAHLFSLAARTIQDYTLNFVEPLLETLESGESALLKRVAPQGDADHVQNLYLTWPREDQETVPQKFEPAPNEYLLIELSQYPGEYKRLVTETVKHERRANAMSVVIDEVLMGALELQDLKAPNSWSLISISRDWIPEDRDVSQDKSQMRQSARFDFSSTPSDYLERAQLWMQRAGSAFQEYLHEDISSFLNESMDESRLIDRQRIFRQQFTEAILASEPLVKLNGELLAMVHQKSIGDRDIVISAMPFDKDGKNYQIASEIMKNQKIWKDGESEAVFDSGRKIYNIDFFSVQLPYQPIVMDSIMEPIWRTWLKHRVTMATRENFLQWRRARPLFETVPASGGNKRAILRGWYIARVLGQLDQTFDDPVLGPHIKIWSLKTNRFESFPYPLMHPGIAAPADYPGVILGSLSIAMVLCNSTGNLEPLIPYHRLIELGEVDNSLSSELINWIKNGRMRDPGQPIPNSSRAGSATDDSENRKLLVTNTLALYKTQFIDEVAGIDHRGDITKLNQSWEIRHEIIKVLDEVIAKIQAVKDGDTGI